MYATLKNYSTHIINVIDENSLKEHEVFRFGSVTFVRIERTENGFEEKTIKGAVFLKLRRFL